jgi:hypothetical protein
MGAEGGVEGEVGAEVAAEVGVGVEAEVEDGGKDENDVVVSINAHMPAGSIMIQLLIQ